MDNMQERWKHWGGKFKKNLQENARSQETLQLKQKKCVYQKMWHGEERIGELGDR